MHKALSMLALSGALVCAPARADIDWSRVDAAIGREGAVIGTVHRYDLPRPDLQVALDGVTLAPGLAGAGWAAFLQVGPYAMMRGDLVVAQSEAPRALETLVAKGVRVSGAHSHMLRARPAPAHLHVSGYGDPAEMAQALRDVARSKARDPDPPAPTSPELAPQELAQIELALGAKGRMALGAWRFVIPRAEGVRASGVPAPPAMGIATALNFQLLGDGRAAVAGEFAALPGEIAALIEALQSGGVEVVALCDHMPDDQPRLFFVHVWALDDAVQLAYALRRGLEVLGADAAFIPPAPAPARARPAP
ncbi:MAG: DUF1259 domain-containing protein [Hyphomicrobiales bacterium]|nr:MAG: DUF1259 domain-containing protein [Hyphomicrobiales bacterium]